MQNVPQFPVTSRIPNACFGISEPVACHGCQELWGCLCPDDSSVTSPESRKTLVLVQGWRTCSGPNAPSSQGSHLCSHWAPRRRRWPEPCCIKQHLKLGRTTGESALPSAPRWPGVARFLLCLPMRQGSCLERIPGSHVGKCVSLLQLQEVRMPQLLSYATPHLLQVPWALHSAQHVGGNTPSPPLSQVAPPHPLPGSNGQAGRCAPPYVMGAGGLPCNLGLAASTTRRMTGSWGRRGMRFPCLSSENPASSQD